MKPHSIAPAAPPAFEIGNVLATDGEASVREYVRNEARSHIENTTNAAPASFLRAAMA
jgi:hypothetical protein